MLSSPTKSLLLKQLEVANQRGFLTPSQSQQIIRESAGYEGEQFLSEYLKRYLHIEHISLYDLHLEASKKEFQIDCLLILQNEIYLLEVKHYRGEYEIAQDDWKNIHTGYTIETPLVQLNRATRLLQNYLKNMQVNIKVNGILILTNPDFLLFNSNYKPNIVLRQQLSRFVDYLNNRQSHLSDWHTTLSEKLKTQHIVESKYLNKLELEFDHLQKGIPCEKCEEWLKNSGSFSRQYLYCGSCDSKFNLDKAILKNIEEYRLLFPERKITVTEIFQWSGGCVSRHAIRKVLNKNYISLGSTKNKHYLPKDNTV